MSTPPPFVLYRYFDARDRPLYIGITGMLSVREGAHRSRSRWMDLAARSTIERYATEDEMRAAEVAAIKAEQPLFNIKHNQTLAAWERLRAYLGEIGRPDLLPARSSYVPAGDPAPVRAEGWERMGERVEVTDQVSTWRGVIVSGISHSPSGDESLAVEPDDGKSHRYAWLFQPSEIRSVAGAPVRAEEEGARLEPCSIYGETSQCKFCRGVPATPRSRGPSSTTM